MKGWLFPFPERLIEAGGTADNRMKQAKEMKGVYYCSTQETCTGSRISVHEALHKHKPTQWLSLKDFLLSILIIWFHAIK